jgi:hypothetical protein
MTYKFAFEKRDYARIDKLNKLTNVDTFYDDVRKLVKNVKSDHAIKSWQCLADQRYAELITGCEDVRYDPDYVDGKFIDRYFDKNGNEVYANGN